MKTINTVTAVSAAAAAATKTKTAAIAASPIIAANAYVTGNNSITVRWRLIDNYPEQILCYKVEWSLSTNFAEVEGVKLTSDVKKSEITINELKHGLKYAFRISAAFGRGFSAAYRIQPELVILSSWEDVLGCKKWSSFDITDIEEQFRKNCSTPLWQTVFPSISAETQVKRKKSGLRTLFSLNSKFVRNVQQGVYLTTVVFTDHKLLSTTDDYIPVLPIDENICTITKEDLYWAMKLSLCWDNIQIYSDNRECSSSSAYFRSKFIEAVTEMQNSFGIKDIGRLYPQTLLHSESGAIFLVSTLKVRETQISQTNSVKWTTVNKLRKKHSNGSIDFLVERVEELIKFHRDCRMRLQRGLYLCYVQLHSSLDSISAVVAKSLPSMLPFVYIRDDPHVSEEEWEWIQELEEGTRQTPTANQLIFVKKLAKACCNIMELLNIDPIQMSIYRIYRLQVVEIDTNVSLILLVPNITQVCSTPKCSTNNIELEESKRSCLSILFPIFELSTLFTTVAIFEQRNCISDDDCQLYHAVTEKLRGFQEELAKLWKNTRWLYNIANEARDKHAKCTLLLEKLMAKQKWSESCENVSLESLKGHAQLSDDKSLSLSDKRRSSTGMLTVNVIRVYAAYQCGFAKGTSVRLQITPSTTSREVVTLVVTQLAKAANAAKLIKLEDVNLHDYCLVAVIGSRERRLRDDFPLLKLQNPWTKGRLFVRRRDRVLEAVHFGNEATV
uniref:Fibronectin type-III domain-containing protein n=1 Tax=Syphacia muris TaxID=451379 RepID=A0A0N5AB76_9BILA